MHMTMGRRARLVALCGGIAAASALALATAGTALADTADTSGTATISVPVKFFGALAKSGVIVVPQSPATESGAGRTVGLSFTVTGGNGEVKNLYGSVHLGGSLLVIDARTGKSATISALRLSLDDGAILGKVGTKTVVVADIGGNLSTDSSTDPVPNETFSASALALDPSCARYLNGKLGTTSFKGGASLGALTANFDVTVS